jgi:hypothetical protein
VELFFVNSPSTTVMHAIFTVSALITTAYILRLRSQAGAGA